MLLYGQGLCERRLAPEDSIGHVEYLVERKIAIEATPVCLVQGGVLPRGPDCGRRPLCLNALSLAIPAATQETPQVISEIED